MPAGIHHGVTEGTEEAREEKMVILDVIMIRTEEFQTTRFFAEQLLSRLGRQVLLEVETYTWGVLPPQLRTGEVADSIIREIRWLQEAMDETDRCP